MFRKTSTTDGAGEVVRTDLLMKNAEALVEGAMYVVTSAD